MSPTFAFGILIALVATAHSQCVIPCKYLRGGGGGQWLQQLQQARERALAQQLASEMSAIDTQKKMCGCCCAETPCISSAVCTCPLEECHEHILEIAAMMSDEDVLFTAKTLTAALQMQQAKQQEKVVATRPVVQELAAPKWAPQRGRNRG